MAVKGVALINSSRERVRPNPSLHPKSYSRLPRLPASGELKRYQQKIAWNSLNSGLT